MTLRATLMSRRGAIFYLLALMALATSILLPRGYMAARGDDGAFRIVMCSGYGPVTLTVVGRSPWQKQGHDDGGQQDHHGTVCPYAGNAAPLSAPGSYEVPRPVFLFGPPPFALPFEGVGPGRGLAAPPPPSHAPPIA